MWELFCAKFSEAQRQVECFAPWEPRNLILRQLPNEIRTKLLLEEEKRGSRKIQILGLEGMDQRAVTAFLERNTTSRIRSCHVGETYVEVTVFEKEDTTPILLLDGRRLNNGKILKVSPVTVRLSQNELISWVTDFLRVDEKARSYQKNQTNEKAYTPGWMTQDKRPEKNVRQVEHEGVQVDSLDDARAQILVAPVEQRSTCHHCGKEGHWVRECPERWGKGKGGKSGKGEKGGKGGKSVKGNGKGGKGGKSGGKDQPMEKIQTPQGGSEVKPGNSQ